MANTHAIFGPTQRKTKEKPKSQHPWEKTIKDENFPKIKYVHNSVSNPIFPEIKGSKRATTIKFTVIGNRTSEEFIYCVHLVKGMHKYRSKIFEAPVIKGVTKLEWPNIWRDVKMKFGDRVCLFSQVLILKNGDFFGGEFELKGYIEAKYAYHINLDYKKEAIQQFISFVKSTGRPFAYLHISIEDKEVGTLIFMLYSDIVPNTCENFLRLCKTNRGGYSGSPVHRIVKDGWIQCGGFGIKTDTTLGCENYIVPFDQRGVLAMCNDGRNNDCSTQFFILLEPAAWMSKNYVAFGQLVDGEKTLKEILKVPTFYEAPTKEIVIYKSGVLNVDCKHEPINPSTRSYLSKHIEDVVTVGELITEAILARVFAVAVAKHVKDVFEGTEMTQHSMSLITQGSTESTEDKENRPPDHWSSENTLDTQSFQAKTFSSKRSTKSPVKPYYWPFTDNPYPAGEKSEDFDIKRFLQGDYCSINDLDEKKLRIALSDVNQNRAQLQKLRQEYSIIPSEIFTFDDDDKLDESEDLDSDEEAEIKEYIRNNVDRVSFAGGIIKQIGKGAALYNLFEGADKSDLIEDDPVRSRRMSMYDRRQSVRKSEMITLNDECLRRLRRASTMERRQSMGAKAMKSALPALDDDQKLRGMSMKAGGSQDHSTFDNRRPSLFAAGRKSVHEVAGIDEEQLKKLRRISMFDRGSDDSAERLQSLRDKKVSISVPRQDRSPSKIMRRPTSFGLPSQGLPFKLPIIIEGPKDDEDDEEFKPRASNLESLKKRRQTAFAEQLTKVKSFQKDIGEQIDEEEEEEEEEEVDEGTGKLKIRLPKAGRKTPKMIMRRPTGFVRKQDLEKIGINVQDEEKGVQISAPENLMPSKIKRRQTGFVPKDVLSKLKSLQDEEDEEQEEEKDKSPSPSGSDDAHVKTAPTTGIPRTTSQLRRPTGFIRPEDLKFLTALDSDEEEEDEEEKDNGEKDKVSEKVDTYEQDKIYADENKDLKIRGESKKKSSARFATSDSGSDDDGKSDWMDQHVKTAPTTGIPRTTSQLRRPTGFIRPEDLKFLTALDSDEEEEDEEEKDNGEKDKVSEKVDTYEQDKIYADENKDLKIRGESKKKSSARFATSDSGSDDDGKSDWMDQHVKTAPTTGIPRTTSQLRRPTGFIRPEDLKFLTALDSDEEEEDEEEKDNGEKDKVSEKVDTYEQDKIYADENKDLKIRGESKKKSSARFATSDSGSDDDGKSDWMDHSQKKRRQTAFAEQLTKVKSFQKDIGEQPEEEEEQEEEEEVDEGTGRIKIALPKGGQKASRQIMRRPTGFVRKQDLEKIGINLEADENKGVQISAPGTAEEDLPTKIKRRQTGYVRKSQVENIRRDDLKEEEGEEEQEEEEKDQRKPKVAGFAKQLESKKSSSSQSFSSSSGSSGSLGKGRVTIDPMSAAGRTTSYLRRPTGFVRPAPDPDVAADEEIEAPRDSLFQRIYDDAGIDQIAAPPTLKDYVPISERIPHNLLLTRARKVKSEPGDFHQNTRDQVYKMSVHADNESFIEVTKAQYSRKLFTKLSDEYVHRLNQIENAPPVASLRTLQYMRVRPSMTVAEYRRMNQEQMKKIMQDKAI